MIRETLDLCPGCDRELPETQYCQSCESYGWEHIIGPSLAELMVIHGSQLDRADLEPKELPNGRFQVAA